MQCCILVLVWFVFTLTFANKPRRVKLDSYKLIQTDRERTDWTVWRCHPATSAHHQDDTRESLVTDRSLYSELMLLMCLVMFSGVAKNS